MLNIKKIQERYQLPTEEIGDAIHKNLLLFGNRVKYQDASWIFEEDALPLLDEIFHFHAKQAGSKDAMPTQPHSASDSKTQEDAIIIQELQDHLKQAQADAAQRTSELNALQEKFIAMQNGSAAMNSSLIRKHQLRAEAAERELEKLHSDFSEKMKLKTERIKELEERIEEMQGKLVENHDEMERQQKELQKVTDQMEALKKEYTERCSTAELKVLNSKRQEDKLYKDIHNGEAKILGLSQKLAAANADRSDAMQKMADMTGQMTELKAQLISMVAGLNQYLEDKDTIPDAASKTVEQVAGDTTSALAPEQKADPSATASDAEMPDATPLQIPPAIPIPDDRKELFEKLRAEQEREKEQASQGFFQRFFGKAASFF